MEHNTTRISDLPENIQMSNLSPAGGGSGGGGGGGVGFPSGNNYVPINIHPNPYGNTDPPNGIIAPVPTNKGRFYEDSAATQHQRLPSRDIRIDQSEMTQDEEIRANYIPKAQNMRDFLKEYETEEAPIIAKHRKNKKKVRFSDDLFAQLQMPILIGILYFIFQMGVFNRILLKATEKFVKLFNDDGSIGFYGNLTKSLLFASAFFAIVKSEGLMG